MKTQEAETAFLVLASQQVGPTLFFFIPRASSPVIPLSYSTTCGCHQTKNKDLFGCDCHIVRDEDKQTKKLGINAQGIKVFNLSDQFETLHRWSDIRDVSFSGKILKIVPKPRDCDLPPKMIFKSNTKAECQGLSCPLPPAPALPEP